MIDRIVITLPKRLSLVIPGLLGPWPNQTESGFAIPEAPALERLLSRAVLGKTQSKGLEATLFELFGLPANRGQELPVAAVTRLADQGDAGAGWWLRADPVHLRADLHAVLLFDARFLGIGAGEAESLVAEFNRTFGNDGLRLEASRPQRWYLRFEDDPGLRTQPLTEVIGRDVNPLLPRGGSDRSWHALLTEIQMLFFGTPVNAQREARGQLPINSLWFWGGGRLPVGAVSPADDIYAGDVVARGLARLAGAAIGSPPENADDWRESAGAAAESLIVLDTTRYDRMDDDPNAWVEHVSALERNWLDPCLAMLGDKTLDLLRLYPCNGCVYETSSRHRWRFWRRTRSLGHYFG